ncbi:carboxypeptidase regulatory-like domain-containing protein [Pseudonocardia sp. RS010]|uniref:carboxypeptidase regulatory-like domain-containing protein n=1 Tax=Pseudonocardia sp. RS010 TaxID=3385979 RepID=UPI0039A081A1
MSTWALVVMVLLVLLAAGIVLVALRRGDRGGATAPEESLGPAPGRTVADLVRDRSTGTAPAPEPVEPAPVAAEPATAEDTPAAPADLAASPADDRPDEPPAERRRVVADVVDAGPVGPPWTRGFVDGVPVEAPPRTHPRQRRSAVDPALVARVTSVSPPAPGRDDRPMAQGIVSPAVAEAVARAEASRRQQATSRPAEDTAVPAPRDGAGRRPMLAVVRGGADDGREVRRLHTAPPVIAVGTGAAASLAEPVVAEPVVEEVEEVEEPPEELPDERPLEVAEEQPEESAEVAQEQDEEIAAVEAPASLAEASTSADAVIDTPAAVPAPAPVTLGPVSPTTSTPEPAPQPGPATGTATRSDEARAAEHAAVDLALLRTLGFADPNPRPGSAPVVDLAVVHEEEAPLAPGRAVPVRFLVVQRDRLPLAEAAVTLLDPRGRETASASADAEGRGEVTAPGPGGYVLVAAADGHQPGVVALTVPDTGSAVAEVEVQLVRSSTVAGSVRDARGSGLAEVAVSLLQDGELIATAITPADGAYRFGELAGGEYTVAAVAEGREPRALPVRVGEEADAAQDVVLAGPVAQSTGAAEHH